MTEWNAKLDLQKLRETMGLSQTRLAEILSKYWEQNHTDDPNHFTTDMILRMEKENSWLKIPVETLILLAKAFGMTLDQMLNYEPNWFNEFPVFENRYGGFKERMVPMLDALERLENTEKAASGVIAPPEGDTLSDVLKAMSRKPRIAFVGKPDSGKSTLENVFLRKEKLLPANWTPTTASIILVKHISDRPEWNGPDAAHSVFVIRSIEGQRWDPDSLDLSSDSYRQTWVKESGGEELLKKYGAKDKNGCNPDDVAAVVVYTDSSVLYNCDFIDLPGFIGLDWGSQREDGDAASTNVHEDTRKSLEASSIADGFVYLCVADSFFYSTDDLVMASSILKRLPPVEKKGSNGFEPFANVFFVATHAMTIARSGSENESNANAVLDNASNMLWKYVAGNASGTGDATDHTESASWQHPSITERNTGYEYSESDLQKRFFAFELEANGLTDKMSKMFVDAFKEFTEALPGEQERLIQKEFDALKKSRLKRYRDAMTSLQQLLANHDRLCSELRSIEENEARRAEKAADACRKVTDTIYSLKKDSSEQFRMKYAEVIESKHIKEVASSIGLKEKRKRSKIEELVTLLNAELENGLADILKENGQKLSDTMDDYIRASDERFDGVLHLDGLKEPVPLGGFDARNVFLGGLAGGATYGALAVWAASLGNLGGYIAVAKVVSVLAALGIHLGGTAAVISAVSALGGPVVFGISAAVIAAVSTIAALGGSWFKVLGSKVAKEFERQKVLTQYLDASDKYWDDTRDAFRKGHDAVEKQWKEHLGKLRDNLMSEEGMDRVNAQIRELETLTETLNSISL